MKEVIKSGVKKFSTQCKTCGCEYSYDIEDIIENCLIVCPECNHFQVHMIKKTAKKSVKTKE